MANKLRTGMDWLNRKLKQHAGESLVYSRGVHSVTLTAIPGKTLLQLNDDLGGVRVEWTDRDYLITASELILNGSVTLPQRGDQIREVIGSQTKVYEVTAPGPEPVWRWSDEGQQVLRVHTKEIGVE